MKRRSPPPARPLRHPPLARALLACTLLTGAGPAARTGPQDARTGPQDARTGPQDARTGPQDAAGPGTHPNIVLAIADDMNLEQVGFLGNPRAHTPSLDRLAAEGFLIHTLWAQPTCRPALATLITGRWPQETGVTSNMVDAPLSPEGALPALLAAGGYATYCAGKFWEGNLASYGFDAPAENDDKFAREGDGQERLFEFLEEHKERPWFVWWAPSLPHTPHRPPERFAKLFEDTQIPLPEGVDASPVKYAQAERASLAMHAWMDAEFQRLMAELERLGELQDTLVLFLADNGWSTNLPAKGTPREAGVRSPLIVSTPGTHARGVDASLLTDLTDVYATALDYAGVAVPPGCRGRSLKPLLEGRPFERRTRLFGSVWARKGGLYALYARDERWKYVLYVRAVNPQELSGGSRFSAQLRRRAGVQELFDLQADPEEQTNLAGLEENATRLAELRAATLAWWHESGGEELPDGY